MSSPFDAAVADARGRYADRRPRSHRLAIEAAAVLPGGNTRSVLDHPPFPFRVARADGARLHDVDGHTYIDLLGDFSAGLLGHSPAAVRDAVVRALDDGWSLGAMHGREAELARLVCERFPSVDLVRFTNSGTEANLMALALAKVHTGRSRVLVMRGGYHGGVLYFGVGGDALAVPHAFVFADFNDLESVHDAVAAHGADLAAILVEPMMGAAGCIPAEPGFLAGLRSVADTCGALLIFDEVMTSRMSVGGAQERTGVVPDLTTLGKYLAGGMSFGAFGGRRAVMAAFDPGSGGTLTHGGTFNNNVVTMAAGIATLRDVLTPEALGVLYDRGEALRRTLNRGFVDAAVPWCATGWGSLLTLHPVPGPVRRPTDLAPADAALRELLFLGLLDEGYYIAPRGYLALSLALTDADVAGFAEAAVTVTSRLG